MIIPFSFQLIVSTILVLSTSSQGKRCANKAGGGTYAASPPALAPVPVPPPPAAYTPSTPAAPKKIEDPAPANPPAAAGLPSNLTLQIRKDAKYKNLADLGTDATARIDNSWMSKCTQGYAFCCWDVDNGGNSKQCSSQKSIHCHGVVIKGTPGTQDFLYSQLTLNYVQVYDHYQQRNYYRTLPGAAHSCDCGENMPQVQRSDASEMKSPPKGKQVTIGSVTYPDPSDPGNFQAAGGNDLKTAYKKYLNKDPANLNNCKPVTATPANPTAPLAAAPANPAGTVTAADMAKHKTLDNCWVKHNANAYDISAWAQKHPGGADVYKPFCGVNDGSFGAALHKQHGSDLAAKHAQFAKECPSMGKIVA